MPTIHINSFVKRQTKNSGFSHWTHSDERLLELILENFPKAKQGYKDGVLLVPVPPGGFFSPIVQLYCGDKLSGYFSRRKENEDPRKSTYSVRGDKMPAKRVDIVLYRHNVLAANNEHETDADWEIVSINASPTEEETPIPVGTMIANHLQLSGGSSSEMTDSAFVEQLRKSVDFWKDKANVAPKPERMSARKKVRQIYEEYARLDDENLGDDEYFDLQFELAEAICQKEFPELNLSEDRETDKEIRGALESTISFVSERLKSGQKPERIEKLVKMTLKRARAFLNRIKPE